MRFVTANAAVYQIIKSLSPWRVKWTISEPIVNITPLDRKLFLITDLAMYILSNASRESIQNSA